MFKIEYSTQEMFQESQIVWDIALDIGRLQQISFIISI